jgi:hypothetical protein
LVVGGVVEAMGAGRGLVGAARKGFQRAIVEHERLHGTFCESGAPPTTVVVEQLTTMR